MKNRTEIKESILNKSRILIEQRQRRKKAFARAAASIAVCFAVGFAVKILMSQNFVGNDKFGNTDQGMSLSPSDDTFYVGGEYGGNDSFGMTEGDENDGIGSDTMRLDEAIVSNAEGCRIPDGIRITALSDMSEIYLYAEDNMQLKNIKKLCNLLIGFDLTALGNNQRIEGKGYLIWVEYGDEEVSIQIFGEILQISGGECMKIPSYRAKELNTFLDQLMEEQQ